MRILLALTVCSFCAVLWVALALARRIRLTQVWSIRSTPRVPLSQEFFEAGAYRTPRPLRLEQEILRRRPRPALSDIDFPHDLLSAAAGVTAVLPELHPKTVHAALPQGAIFASIFGRSVAIAPIGVRQGVQRGTLLPEGVSGIAENDNSRASSTSAPSELSLHRRPPQPSRSSGLRRIDLSHYNRDMGDLTDPYTYPQRGSGTKGPVPVDRSKR